MPKMYWFKGEPGRVLSFQLKLSEAISASPSAEAEGSSERSLCRKEQASRGQYKDDSLPLLSWRSIPSTHTDFNLTCELCREDVNKHRDDFARQNPASPLAWGEEIKIILF